MSAQTSFSKRVAYHFWATDRLIECLSDDDAHNRARGYIAHALVADRVWMTRLKGEPLGPLVLFPDATLEKIMALRDESFDFYSNYSDAAELDATVEYTNTKGIAYQNTVEDILNHVLMHGMYHRGQAATALREAGSNPPATDFIVFAGR